MSSTRKPEKIHRSERRSVPRKPPNVCWVCHESLPYGVGEAVFDAGIMVRYHRSPSACNQAIETFRKVYDRSKRGRFRPASQLRNVTYGFGCRVCRKDLREVTHEPQPLA